MNGHMKEVLDLGDEGGRGKRNMFDLALDDFAEEWYSNDQRVVERGWTVERDLEEEIPTRDGTRLSPVTQSGGSMTRVAERNRSSPDHAGMQSVLGGYLPSSLPSVAC